MQDNLPSAALGHFVLKVSNLERSYRFYSDLGLRAFAKIPEQGFAIIELRGGTHLLLLDQNTAGNDQMTEGRVGQLSHRLQEHLDFVIGGKSRDDLATFRDSLLEKSIAADDIAEGELFGHHFFRLTDPDGHGITFYTSHVGSDPV
jgi:catechol 2,3-dioxygenase-like lactoylglutathione lyase family enzyme